MKKYAFIALLCFCIEVGAQTNVYHPFPLNSATWRFDYSDSNCMGYCFTYDNIMKDDTIINLYLYKQYGQGAIRQDIPLKKIYYYDYTSSSEFILFDFNLSVGDTIPHTWYGNQNFTDSVFVQSKDSAFVNGQWRNKFILHNQSFSFSQFELIEGLGNTLGNLSPFQPCICGVELICFKGDGMLQLSNPSGHSNCDNLVGINEYSKEEIVSVSPNPTNGEFTIVLPTDNAEINVTDLLGQQIIKRRATQKTTNLQLDENGVYIINITTIKGTATRKLIVNR